MKRLLRDIVQFGNDTALATVMPIDKRVEYSQNYSNGNGKSIDILKREVSQVVAGFTEIGLASVVLMYLPNDYALDLISTGFLALDGFSRMITSNGLVANLVEDYKRK